MSRARLRALRVLTVPRLRRVGVAAAFALLAVGCTAGGEGTEQATPMDMATPPGSSGMPSTPVTQAEPPVPYEPPHTRPGPAADRVFFRSFHVDRAPLHLEAGEMDLYLFSLKTAAARELVQDADVRLYEAPASTISIVVNPSPAPEGELNPFTNQRLRQAVHHLLDRDFIVNEIYQGRALPMVTHLSPTDFDFLTVFDQAKAADLAYDPERARAIIRDEMTAMGAELVDDRWEFEGQPIRLKFIIRVEDERREVGDLLRVELERAGFTVSASYQQFAPAVLTVYSSDPQAFQWHLYTEGWGRSAPTRYDFATINQMTAPWLGNMPGWREAGFWQYEHAELDALGQRLFTGQFTSAAERDDIYRRMTELSLEESVRLGVVTVLNSFPALRGLAGVTNDLVAGPRAPWTVREAYVPGQDVLTVGNLWVWTERTIWNPVGGFGDVYSTDIWRNLHDPPLWNHPFTGIPQPFRAAFEVETGGPVGKLEVPADAVLWDAVANRWTPVGPGVTATSRVVFDSADYVTSRWHHGEPVTMADVVYPIAQAFELAYDQDKSRVEFALGVTARPYLDTLRGFRLLNDTQLEVYADFWHFNAGQIAAYASPSGVSMPWEILAAMDDLVFEQRRAAYSATSAARFTVPWLSLVMERDARLVDRTLREMTSDVVMPAPLLGMGDRDLATREEAQARYGAARAWFDRYGLLVISNGPYFLVDYDPPAQFAELEAFRDPSYPYRPGDWYFGAPPLLRVGRVHAERLEAGVDAAIAVEVEGPGTLGLRYVLVNAADGALVASGAGARSGDAFVVELSGGMTRDLEAGIYRLSLAASSDEVAILAEREVDLELLP